MQPWLRKRAQVCAGIDLVTLNSEGKVSRFEVMARPPKAVLHLLELQTAFMTEMGMVKPVKAKL